MLGQSIPLNRHLPCHNTNESIPATGASATGVAPSSGLPQDTLLLRITLGGAGGLCRHRDGGGGEQSAQRYTDLNMPSKPPLRFTSTLPPSGAPTGPLRKLTVQALDLLVAANLKVLAALQVGRGGVGAGEVIVCVWWWWWRGESAHVAAALVPRTSAPPLSRLPLLDTSSQLAASQSRQQSRQRRLA